MAGKGVGMVVWNRSDGRGRGLGAVHGEIPAASAGMTELGRGYAQGMIEQLDRTRLTGAVLMGAAALELLLFLRGVSRGSYAALAIPAAVLVIVISALVFWTGWTLLTVRDELEELEFAVEPLDDV